MFTIDSIACRTVYNSRVKPTHEFIVSFRDGGVGSAASSQGETISIYEDRKVIINPEDIIQVITQDGLLTIELDQIKWDEYLQKNTLRFGRNNAFALSEAFFYAACSSSSAFEVLGVARARPEPPRLCLNILNGGWHAYTNPVLSDFSEFMLVAKSSNVLEVIDEHNDIQRLVREKQLLEEKTVVSSNLVNCFPTRDNREVIEFLLEIVAELGLAEHYELMIDASAGDLWDGTSYCLGITDGLARTSEEFVKYWLDLIKQYDVRFLEDPFHERDFASWKSLTAAQLACCIVGDNLYSSDAERIRDGVQNAYSTGVVIKPNQAGTVTAVRRALQAAQETGQTVITSHRSISTESTFLSLLTCLYNAPLIKIGPLGTDYSSILRLNAIIRLTEGSCEQKL